MQATSLHLAHVFISLDLPVQNAGLSQDKELISLLVELWLSGGFAAGRFALSGSRFCDPGFLAANKALCSLHTAAPRQGKTQASVRPDSQNQVLDGLAAYQDRVSVDPNELFGCFSSCLDHVSMWVLDFWIFLGNELKFENIKGRENLAQI